MDWVYLLLAGAMEIGWPVGMRISQAPGYRAFGLILSVCCMVLSGVFLWQAQKTIPMGTAYAIWTGIGAAGAFAVGICFFGEPRSVARMISVMLIIVGMIGLKLSHRPA